MKQHIRIDLLWRRSAPLFLLFAFAGCANLQADLRQVANTVTGRPAAKTSVPAGKGEATVGVADFPYLPDSVSNRSPLSVFSHYRFGEEYIAGEFEWKLRREMPLPHLAIEVPGIAPEKINTLIARSIVCDYQPAKDKFRSVSFWHQKRPSFAALSESERSEALKKFHNVIDKGIARCPQTWGGAFDLAYGSTGRDEVIAHFTGQRERDMQREVARKNAEREERLARRADGGKIIPSDVQSIVLLKSLQLSREGDIADYQVNGNSYTRSITVLGQKSIGHTLSFSVRDLTCKRNQEEQLCSWIEEVIMFFPPPLIGSSKEPEREVAKRSGRFRWNRDLVEAVPGSLEIRYLVFQPSASSGSGSNRSEKTFYDLVVERRMMRRQ